MTTLFAILAVLLTITIIFGRRVARWLVIIGLSIVVLVVAGVFAYAGWMYWSYRSSDPGKLEEITNRLLDEQIKYNLPLDQEIPLWRVEEIAKETLAELKQNHINSLTENQVTQIMQNQEAQWKTWLASPECALEMWRSSRKNLGDFAAFQLLKPEDKQLLRQHPELLTDEERKLLDRDSNAKIGS